MSRTVTPGSIETQRSSHRIATLTPLRMTYVSLPSNSTVYSGSVICVTALLLIAPLLGSSANCNRRLRLKLPWLVREHEKRSSQPPSKLMVGVYALALGPMHSLTLM